MKAMEIIASYLRSSVSQIAILMTSILCCGIGAPKICRADVTDLSGAPTYASQYEGQYGGTYDVMVSGKSAAEGTINLIVASTGTISGTFVGPLRPNPTPPPVYQAGQGTVTGTVASTDGTSSMTFASAASTLAFSGSFYLFNGLMEASGTFSGGGLSGTWILFLHSPPLTLFDANYEFSKVNLADSNLSSIGSAQISTLTADSHMCDAAIADGATKILLKYVAPSAGTVEFSETQGYAANGDVLETLNGVSSKTAPVAVSTQLVNGQNVAFALYNVPDTLPSVTVGKTNPVQFEATFKPISGAFGAYSPALLPLYVPPVVFIHGFASNPKTWLNSNRTGPVYSVFATGISATAVDYSATNMNTFASNQIVLLTNPGGIQEVLDAYRDSSNSVGTAITKVDVVGHSMGGILTRELGMWPHYANLDNFYSGYVHRLITIGTPHLGSKASNYIVNFATGSVGALGISTLQKLGWPYGGAFADLAYGSPAVQHIRNSVPPIPCFAVAGVSNFPNSDPTLTSVYSFLSLVSLANHGPLVTSTSVFPNEGSDLIVGTTSAGGGLPALYVHRTTNSTDHLQEPSSSEIGTLVAGLLTGPASAFDANGFPDVSSVAYPSTDSTDSPSATVATSPFLTITSPPASQTFLPGATVKVTVTPQAGTTLSAIAIMMGPPNQIIGSQLITAAPFTATFTIPANYVGDLPINVLATDATSRMCVVSNDCAVKTAATLSALTLSATSATFPTVGSTSQLIVDGSFSDSVTRDVTQSRTGTTYISSNTAVLSVSGNGLLAAVGNGSSLITVTNGTAVKSVQLGVALAPPAVLMVTPATGVYGAVVSISLVGYSLGGTTAVKVYLNGAPDPNVSISNLAVGSSSGLTCVATISKYAVPGVRTIVVTTKAGSSNATAAPDMAGFTIQAPLSSATFVKTDTTTQGSWKSAYGVDGWNVIADPSANNPHYPTYATLSPSGFVYGLWASTSTAVKCLQTATVASTNRMAGVWYNPVFTINLNVTGKHQVALYLLDYASVGYAETITITDAASGAVLDAESASGFANGVYKVWNVSGKVVITFRSTAGHYAVISGVFFG